MVVVAGPPKPAMRIYVPYTKIQDATMASLLWYLPHVTFVDVSGDQWDYVTYFEQRWAERETFINVEHDVVPAPRMLEELWACPHDWCESPYIGPPIQTGPPPSFGCVKFSKAFIEALPDVWRARRLDTVWPGRDDKHVSDIYCSWYKGAWCGLDVWLSDYIEGRDGILEPHQHHFPLAVHAKHEVRFAPMRMTDAHGNRIAAPKRLDLTFKTL